MSLSSKLCGVKKNTCGYNIAIQVKSLNQHGANRYGSMLIQRFDLNRNIVAVSIFFDTAILEQKRVIDLIPCRIIALNLVSLLLLHYPLLQTNSLGCFEVQAVHNIPNHFLVKDISGFNNSNIFINLVFNEKNIALFSLIRPYTQHLSPGCSALRKG